MKAILIINKPTECVDCPCAIESEGSYWCNAECKDVTTEAYEGIPKWCPLKPMPQKIESGKIEDGTKTNIPIPVEHFAMGWNACLEEILNDSN